ncbi:MAG: hypothetical protein AAF702_01625 [Chloroflexota bacterium]
MKKRMIHISFFEDEDVAKLSIEARLMLIGMIVLADDEGRLKINTKYLRSKIFPYDDFTTQRISELLAEVHNTLENVHFYESNGKKFAQFEKWYEYQNLRKDRIIKSKIPSPHNDNQVTTTCQPTDNQTATTCQPTDTHNKNFWPHNIREDKLSKDNIREVKNDAYATMTVVQEPSSSKSYGSISSLSYGDLLEISDKYQVPMSFTKSKLDDMVNYCEARGKRYKNYFRALSNWVKKDALKRKEAREKTSGLVYAGETI